VTEPLTTFDEYQRWRSPTALAKKRDEKIMKSILIAAAACSLLSTAAFADATLSLKGTNSNGSSIGQQSSQATGNGGWVSGNNGPDQTTYPGSRADAVHASNTGVPGQHNK
jgi:hypothetical protein